MTALINSERDGSQSDFEENLNFRICVLRDNVIKRSTKLGISNPSQLWAKSQALSLNIASSYISRLWNYKEFSNLANNSHTSKTPNFSMSKILVLSMTLDCSVNELLSDDVSTDNDDINKLSFSGVFYDRMVQACSEAIENLVSMEKIQILKPLISENVVDLQFSSFNEKKEISTTI